MRPHDEMDSELTPGERAAFAALPREREPSRLLEERTVRALRERGLVHAAASQRRLRFPASWLVGAAAAAVALFMVGVETGRTLQGRQTAQVVELVAARNTQQAALAVQQTGSAYVNALSQFASLADSSRNQAQTRQGREVAVQMLRAAANELVRISPDDPLAAAILASLDRTRVEQQRQQADTAGKERVVWF
jgi:hypothetical protein